MNIGLRANVRFVKCENSDPLVAQNDLARLQRFDNFVIVSTKRQPKLLIATNIQLGAVGV